MLYVYAPATQTCIPRLGIEAPGEYDLDPSEVEALNSRIEGKGGAPAFVPAGDVPSPKRTPKAKAEPKAEKPAPVTVDPSVEVT